MKNKWEIVKKYINSHAIFTKKQFSEEINYKICNSMSQYILLSMNSGFIQRIGRGKYQRKMFIPENMSLSKMTILSYNKEEREKYSRKHKLIELDKLNN